MRRFSRGGVNLGLTGLHQSHARRFRGAACAPAKMKACSAIYQGWNPVFRRVACHRPGLVWIRAARRAKSLELVQIPGLFRECA
jgi:hypothetical protein